MATDSATSRGFLSAVAALPRRVFRFYYDGFRSMGPVGRSLWLIILLKLFIFFIVLRIFFFPNLLERDYDTDAERAQAVRQHLTDPSRELSVPSYKLIKP